MNLKTFFGLRESVLHEMAGMPQDNPFNEFLYKMIMKEYGYTWPGQGGAWPRDTPAKQKEEDVMNWYKLAAAQGIRPSNINQSPASVVGQLNWPFLVGAGMKSKNATANMRQLVVRVGFAQQEDIDALEAEEAKKAAAKGGGAAPEKAAAAGPTGPRMAKTFKTLAGPAATPPTVRKGGEAPAAAPAAAPEAPKSSEKKSSDTWNPGGTPASARYKPPEDDPDFQ